MNKATIEALIRAGAFDAIHSREERASMVASIEAAVSAGQSVAADKAAGQGALFGFGGGEEVQTAEMPETPLVQAEGWSEAETLRQEKETLGFYVSSHPMEEWGDWVRVFTPLTVGELKSLAAGQACDCACDGAGGADDCDQERAGARDRRWRS